LYQIESGKTELPRAGTLRRIALALDVSMETLLGHVEDGAGGNGIASSSSRKVRAGSDWVPSEGGPLTIPGHRGQATFEDLDGARFSVDPYVSPAHDALNHSRERELTWKLHELLASPLGEGVARIVEETYRLLPPVR
jgi:hypothetical protein